MRVAMIVGPWFLVPPDGFGGAENVVHALSKELVRRGTDVILYSVRGSNSAPCRWLFDEPQFPYFRSPERETVELTHAWFAYNDALREQVDVIHDHTVRVGPAIGAAIGKTPVLHTVHMALSAERRRHYGQLTQTGHFFLAMISQSQRTTAPELPVLAVVPNALDVELFPFRVDKGDYLLSLGRVNRDKGVHLCIEIARRAGMPLKIAGPILPSGGEHDYFARHIEPFLSDVIEYVGEANNERKFELLANAKALLFPVQWEEPFGMVAIEALACGTPVVATPRGAIPEIVRDGVEGFLSEDLDDLVRAVGRLHTLSPHQCRARVEADFNPARLADDYEHAYEQAIQRSQ